MLGAASRVACRDGLDPKQFGCLVVLIVGVSEERVLFVLWRGRFGEHGFVFAGGPGLLGESVVPRVQLLQFPPELCALAEQFRTVRLGRGPLVPAEHGAPEAAGRGQLLVECFESCLSVVQLRGAFSDRVPQHSGFADGRGPFGNVLIPTVERERVRACSGSGLLFGVGGGLRLVGRRRGGACGRGRLARGIT
ncbi:hypothetical protein [Streptomyces sp. NPDC054784]